MRYADDLVVGFEHEHDAQRFLTELRKRLEQFALTLHPEKTRLIEFGRLAVDNRVRRGERRLFGHFYRLVATCALAADPIPTWNRQCVVLRFSTPNEIFAPSRNVVLIAV